jgi:hypothetical protein
MNRSMMPQQIMAYNQGGIASFVPQQTQIMGQPHRLAYVNPQEEQMMLNAGGAGLPGPGGIPAYWTLTEPSTWAGGSNYEPGAGFQGIGNFNASDNNNAAATSNDDDNNNSAATSNDDDNGRVGFVDSLAMGLGFKDKTPAYYNTTAQTIAANQGQTAAQNYLKGLADDGKISSDNLGIFSDAASQVSFNDNNNNNNDDNNNVVDSVNETGTDETGTDETGTDETVDGEEEIQYTQMKPFYGGYQPSTVASTLVPSQLTRPTGSNPRLDPIFPQQPPMEYIDDGIPPIDPGFNIDSGPINKGRNFDFGAPANLGDTHYDPELDTTYTYQEKPDGQGGFYSGWDITQGTGPEVVLYGGGGSQGLMNNDMSAQGVGNLFGNEQATTLPAGDLMNDPNYRGDGTNFGMVMPEINPLTGQPQNAPVNNGGQFNSLAELDAYQQQNPSLNLMGEYERLRALEGGIPAVAQLPNRGIASIFGNEQAPQYMYQGIMG